MLNRYECTCDCNGTLTCNKVDATYTCGNQLQTTASCRQCLIAGEIVEGRTSFNLTWGCIDYNCRCSCDGTWSCPARSAISRCINILFTPFEISTISNTPEDDCKSCSIDGSVYPGNSQYQFVQGCIRHYARCYCNGGYQFASSAEPNCVSRGEGSTSGQCQKCIMNGKTYQENSNFDLQYGCVTYRCQCSCEGVPTCTASGNFACGTTVTVLRRMTSSSSSSSSSSSNAGTRRVITRTDDRTRTVSTGSGSRSTTTGDGGRTTTRGSGGRTSGGRTVITTGSRTPGSTTRVITSGGRQTSGGTVITTGGRQRGGTVITSGGRQTTGTTVVRQPTRTRVELDGTVITSGGRQSGGGTITTGGRRVITTTNTGGGSTVVTSGGSTLGSRRVNVIETERPSVVRETTSTRVVTSGNSGGSRVVTGSGGSQTGRVRYVTTNGLNRRVSGCIVNGQTYHTGQEFDYIRACVRYRCECEDIGGAQCKPVGFTSCAETVESTCTACYIDGTRYRTNQQFSIKRGCAQLSCLCQCRGRAMCISNEIPNCQRRPGRPNIPTSQCTACVVNGVTYPSQSEYPIQDGCMRSQCRCDCQGRHTCAAPVNSCEVGGRYPQCRSCSANGRRYSLNEQFTYQHGCWSLQCFCNCEGDYVCNTGNGVYTCATGAGFEREPICRACSVNGYVIPGDRKFTKREGCYEYKCQCFCSGDPYCVRTGRNMCVGDGSMFRATALIDIDAASSTGNYKGRSI